MTETLTMHMISRLVVSAALVAGISLNSTAATLDDPAQLEAFIDGVVQPLMKSNPTPSGTVAIARDGQLLLAKGYGFEDIEARVPVDPFRTLFRPGSVSKLFTWVAVMQQVEQGNLDLDTDVNQYLQGFSVRDAFDQPVTLRAILTHTAGFEDGGLGYLIIDDPEQALPLAEAMQRYQPKRVNPPFAQTAYSNYATALAGLIVANVSGMPFNEYIQKHIFDPLGMRNASFEEPLPEHLAARMANSYGQEAGAFVDRPFEIISSFGPAGAQSATATDMLRFAQAILNGGELDGQRILKQSTVDEMLSQQFSHDPRMLGMGLGFYATDYNGQVVWGHGGDTRYFHSYLGIDRANKLAFFVSFGSDGGSAVRTSFAPALYDEFFPRDEPRPEAPQDFLERAAKYAGQYGFWRGNFSKFEKAFKLPGGLQVAPTPDNTLLISMGSNAKQYVEIDDNLFQQLDPNFGLMPGFSPRLIAFQENEEGEITGFVIDGLPFMSLRKLPVHETSSFNFALLGLSLLIFVLVILRRFYQRRVIRQMPSADRAAIGASVLAAALNLLAVVLGAVVISIVADSLMGGIPLLFKLWLILPILATLASLYLLYRTIDVWRNRLLTGFWARLRFTFVALCGLFMSWFFYFWNILGFQYF